MVGRRKKIRYSPAQCLGTQTNGFRESRPETRFDKFYRKTEFDGSAWFTPIYEIDLGFSKKLENHIHALSVHYMHYNFARIHKTMRCTPAMEANITSKLWEISEMLELFNTDYAKKRGDSN